MRRSLGKGLAQLVGESTVHEDPTGTDVSIDSIVPNPRQPRSHFDEAALDELADSIRVHGVLQPLLVRRLGRDRYELIAGERRLRAAKRAGLAAVPVVVRTAGGMDTLEMAIVENVQREDISAIEAARAYRRLSDEFRLTQEQIADKVGKSRVAIANTIRLLKLPPKILEGLERNQISEGHARALLTIDDPALQLALFNRILERGLTVRDVEKAGQAMPSRIQKSKKKGKAASADANWIPLAEGMSTYFGAPVELQKTDKGGRITIDFYSDDDLERILEILGIHL